MSLRPPDIDQNNSRLLINYQNAKCIKQVLVINKFSKLPIEAAKYLNLPHSQKYPDFCFRRSFTMLANS